MTKAIFKVVPCVGKAEEQRVFLHSVYICTPLRGKEVGNMGSQKLCGKHNSQELFPKWGRLDESGERGREGEERVANHLSSVFPLSQLSAP